MSDYNDSELDDFIVSDEEQAVPHQKSQHAAQPDSVEDSQEAPNRLASITNTLKPGEDQTQKVLKAHISVLVSALGGPDHTSDEIPVPYKLGQEALACLKDLKRWIKTVDERLNSFDVALACAESGLVNNDLVAIMCQWERQKSAKIEAANKKSLIKILLSCLELLVLLTWPVELTPESSDKQRIAFPKLRKMQLIYKKHILNFNNGQTLKAVLRLVLPHLTKPRLEREPRDNAIIRMGLFFIRNVLYIEPATTSVSTSLRKQLNNPDNLPTNVTRDDISINTVLRVFQKNNVLTFLLTIIGSLGTEYDREVFGHCALECIYLITKDISPHFHRLVDTDKKSKDLQHSSATSELESLLVKETKRKNDQTSSVSTRHGRFGSLLSLQGEEASYVISGQDALHNTNSTLAKLDKSKKWHSRSTFRYDSDNFVSDTKQYLTAPSKTVLVEFLNNFLDSGCFNNLIESVGWLFTSNGDLMFSDPYEKAAYFSIIAWFFRYKKEQNELKAIIDYGSVGVALNETNFILQSSYIKTSYESKDWSSLHVALISLNELLMISNSIFTRKMSEDEDESTLFARELAEGIIHKLFETKQLFDLLIEIPKSAAKHSPDYLNVCVSVVHIILKTFENFANEDISLYVKSKRKQSKKKKKIQGSEDEGKLERFQELVEGSDDEENDRIVKIVTKERKLDFNETEVRFFHPSIVTTHISYLSRYEDLTHEEIKKALSYFHRLFVVRKDFTNLYRLDFMQLIHKLRSNLPLKSKIREHVDEFIYYFMKKFKLAMERFPMAIEILFPRIEDLSYKTYLGSGELFIKEPKSSRAPKLARDIEFTRSTFTKDEQIKILCTSLFEQEREFWLHWFVSELDIIIKKRILNESEPIVLKSESEIMRLFINNAVVRLLLITVGFIVPNENEGECHLPPSVSVDNLSENLQLLQKWISMQPVEFEDGHDSSFYLRAKDFNEDDEIRVREDSYNMYDDSIAFETEGRNGSNDYFGELEALDELEKGIPRGQARKKKKVQKSVKPKATTKSRRAPRLHINSEDEDELPVKSSAFVRDSDDESDDEKLNEFFEREEKLRQMLEASGGIVNATQLAEFKKAWSKLQSGDTAAAITKAMESTLFVDEIGNESEELQSPDRLDNPRKKRRIILDEDDDDNNDDD